MINYEMEIIPAIPIETLHKIQRLLESEGYYVRAGEVLEDMAACAIDFHSYKDEV